jgi:hypothetical protein
MGSALTADSIIIDNHNLTSVSCSYAPVLLGADDAAFTTNVVEAAVLTTVDDETCYKTFDSISKRYWRVKYSSSAALDEAPRIGNIFIGSAMEFTTPYDYGYKIENPEYATNEKTTLSGIKRSSQYYKGRLVYEINFRLQSEAFRTQFQNFVKAVRGRMYPFYFIDTDGTTVRYMNLTSDYVPVSVPYNGYGDIESLVMKTNLSTY